MSIILVSTLTLASIKVLSLKDALVSKVSMTQLLASKNKSIREVHKILSVQVFKQKKIKGTNDPTFLSSKF